MKQEEMNGLVRVLAKIATVNVQEASVRRKATHYDGGHHGNSVYHKWETAAIPGAFTMRVRTGIVSEKPVQSAIEEWQAEFGTRQIIVEQKEYGIINGRLCIEYILYEYCPPPAPAQSEPAEPETGKLSGLAWLLALVDNATSR